MVLTIAFDMLYRHLVFFHERTGVLVFGASWHGRRLICLRRVRAGVRVLDLGAGEGRLVAEAHRQALHCLGIEPSPHMRRAALRAGIGLIDGSSEAMPLPPSSVDTVLSTYPGNWILRDATWAELRRITKSGSTVIILLGGTYERGPWSWIRSRIVRLAYGGQSMAGFEIPAAVGAGFCISVSVCADRWGRHVVFEARRQD